MTKSTDVQYRSYPVEEYSISSAFVADRFRIKVLRPISRTDCSERFPVLYVTDGDEFFSGLATLANSLHFYGEVQRFILVGIGYEEAGASAVLRMRDLLTHGVRVRFHRVIEQLVESPLVTGMFDLNTITKTTDSEQFLQFIREELVPFIDKRYSVIPGENNYWGYSAGGTFGLYTLFTQPASFRRYIVGSPSTSYHGANYALEIAKAFAESGRNLSAQLFMSVGELEEFYAHFDLTTGYYKLAKFLRSAAIPGLDMKLCVFPGETHATAWVPAFSHGVRMLFPADRRPAYYPEFD